MAIASFGSKVFQVSSNKMYTFDELQYTSSLQTDKQDAEGRKPSTYNKGPDLDTMSFKIRLDTAFGISPRKEWEDWRNIMNSGTAYYFILGGKPISPNKFLAVSVNPSNMDIDNSGRILSMDLEISFEEFVRVGKNKDN